MKAATEAQHLALHRSILPHLRDAAAYRRFLHALMAFHIAMLPRCQAGGTVLRLPHLAGMAEHRLQRLRDDLAALGVPVGGMPRCQARNCDPAFAVGALYVAQGSTLGAAAIGRHLQAFLPSGIACSFLAAGPADAAAWPCFCERLEQYGNRPGRIGLMIAGARDSFSRFTACLEAQHQ